MSTEVVPDRSTMKRSKYWEISENNGDDNDRKYTYGHGGYFCLTMPDKFLCLDLKKSKPVAPDNPKCYKLTKDLRPIAEELDINICGAQALDIKGETYFVGGEYSGEGIHKSNQVLPHLHRMRFRSESNDVTGSDLKATLEPGFGADAVGFPPRMNAVKLNPIVEKIGNKVYVLHTGGYGRSGREIPKSVFEALDLTTLTWSTLPDPPFVQSNDGYYSESYICGHSVIGDRLFIVTADNLCAVFNTGMDEGDGWSHLPQYDRVYDVPPVFVGKILLWPGISCGSESTIKVPRNRNRDKEEDVYICFVRNTIYLVQYDGTVVAAQRHVFDVIFKGLAYPYIGSYITDKGITFIPSPYKDTKCAIVLIHDYMEDYDNMPSLCISFFRPVIDTSAIYSIVDGSYQLANPDATDYSDLHFVDLHQDHGYVFDFSEHFDDIDDDGFSGPAFFV